MHPLHSEGVVVSNMNNTIRVWIRSCLYNSLYHLISLGERPQEAFKISDHQRYALDVIRAQKSELEQLWKKYYNLEKLFSIVKEKYENLTSYLSNEYETLRNLPPEEIRQKTKQRDKTEKLFFRLRKEGCTNIKLFLVNDELKNIENYLLENESNMQNKNY